MNSKWYRFLGFGLVSGAFAFANTTVTGKAFFKGVATQKILIKMASDPVCVKQNAGKQVFSDSVTVNSNGTLANVFVYIKEGVKGSVPPPTEPVVFDQKGCIYTPHVFGIRVNQPFHVINSDPTLHNVNAAAKQTPNRFNNGMPIKGMKIEKKFTKPETMVRIKCDVHGWMLAYAGVLEHPYFSVTDSTGAFSIKELPPGDYTLVAWHEKFGEQTSKLTVAQTSKSVDFTFQ